jgi:hypothetical protein
MSGKLNKIGRMASREKQEGSRGSRNEVKGKSKGAGSRVSGLDAGSKENSLNADKSCKINA